MNATTAEQLERWLDGSLDQGGADALTAALAADDGDRALARDVAATHRRLAAWFDAGSPERTAAAVAGRLRATRVRRRWWLPVAAAALILAAAAWVLTGPGPDQPIRDGRPLAVGTPVGAGVLVWPDGTRVVLLPGAEATVADAGLRLDRGGLAAEVRPRTARPFTVTTARASATVLGTSFTLHAATASTWLSVASGRVRLEAGAAVEVGPGAHAVADGTGVRLVEAQPATWRNARPVALVMVAEPGHERSGNPRGYGNEPGWDAATPAGRAEIGALIAGRIDAAAEAIHRRGGQGLILWDGEGRDGTGGGYHGDPRRALLADEALPALDAAFARVRARGLEPGVLVATDLEGLAGCADLVDRLAWARERWGIGLAAINNLPAGLDLRLVAAAVPQVRLITVEGHPMARDAGYAYRDRADGAAPDRTAILVHGDDAPAALAAALAGGAMVLLPAWYQSPELDLYDRVRAGP